MTLPARSLDLFPVQANAETDAICWRLLTDERDGQIVVLRGPLQAGDRQRLRARLAAINPHLQAGHPKDVARAVVEMLAGFSQGGGETGEQIKTAAYVKALLGLPLWAIVRACGKFSRGEVDAAEVGARALDRSFAPSAAQLRMVAEKIALPAYDEQRRISHVLNGMPRQPEMSEAQKSRMVEKLQGLALALRKVSDSHKKADAEEAHVYEERIGKVMLEASANLRRKEYEAAGIEPSDTESLGLRKLLKKEAGSA